MTRVATALDPVVPSLDAGVVEPSSSPDRIWPLVLVAIVVVVVVLAAAGWGALMLTEAEAGARGR